MSRAGKVGVGVGILAAGLFLLLAIAWITQTVKPYRLPSESMVPTYKPGDRVMAGRNGFPFSKAGPGDAVISWGPEGEGAGECGAPQQPGAPCAKATARHTNVKFIKRIVAVGGDRVSIRGGRAVVNGRPLDEPYARLDPACETCNMLRDITVPPHSFFLMGDNRGNSTDSRVWGPVPEAWIRGKVLFKYWG